jgi:hypothetical protein
MKALVTTRTICVPDCLHPFLSMFAWKTVGMNNDVVADVGGKWMSIGQITDWVLREYATSDRIPEDPMEIHQRLMVHIGGSALVN